MRLIDRYAPKTLEDFVGLDEPKKIIGRYLNNPDSRAFMFIGESGTGKSRMAEAMVRAVNGEPSAYNYIRVPSQECTIDMVRDIQNRLNYAPWGRFWVVQVEEADRMTEAAQVAFLSLLDTLPANTLIIFTCNETGKLEPRFLSRCCQVKFSNYGLNGAGAFFLKQIWDKEAGTMGYDHLEVPNFVRVLKDSRNNLRDALNRLEMEVSAL